MGPVRKTQPSGSLAFAPILPHPNNTGKSITSSSQAETEGPHPTWKIPQGTSPRSTPTMRAPQCVACPSVLISSSGVLLSRSLPHLSRNLEFSISGLCLLTLSSHWLQVGKSLSLPCFHDETGTLWERLSSWLPQCHQDWVVMDSSTEQFSGGAGMGPWWVGSTRDRGGLGYDNHWHLVTEDGPGIPVGGTCVEEGERTSGLTCCASQKTSCMHCCPWWT